MILELNKTEFYKCKDLLPDKGHLEARAIIHGVNPGRIFVDDNNHPTTGFIWLGNNDGFHFIGDENNEGFNTKLDHFIEAFIKPEAKKVGLTWFEAIGTHNKWYETLEKTFHHRKLSNWNQRVYTLKKSNFKGNEAFPDEQDYQIVKMSEALFYNIDQTIQNIEFLHAKLSEFWSSTRSFFDEGIGYCIIHKNEIVSVCFSGFVFENVHCIDIETLKEHQGKKLAQKVASTYVEDCLTHNLVPYWDCMESNKPSIAVAENLGFTNSFNYKGYEFPID